MLKKSTFQIKIISCFYEKQLGILSYESVILFLLHASFGDGFSFEYTENDWTAERDVSSRSTIASEEYDVDRTEGGSKS